MCGRYTGNDDIEEMSDIYKRTHAHYPSAKLNHGEIFPTYTVPIIYGEKLIAVPAKWGYPKTHASGVFINARSETASEKATFSDSLLNRRCAIPTTGYYEWDKNKTKYKINRPDEAMLYLGGFCKRFDDGARFVILTTAPNDSVSHIHNRMPIILGSDEASLKKWNEDTEWAMYLMKSQMPKLSAVIV